MMFYWTQEIQNGIMSQWVNKCKILKMDLPGGPVVETPPFHCRGHGFCPWPGKFHKLCSVAKKKKRKKNIEELFSIVYPIVWRYQAIGIWSVFDIATSQLGLAPFQGLQGHVCWVDPVDRTGGLVLIHRPCSSLEAPLSNKARWTERGWMGVGDGAAPCGGDSRNRTWVKNWSLMWE